MAVFSALFKYSEIPGPDLLGDSIAERNDGW